MTILTIDHSKRIMATGGNSISAEICFIAHLVGYELVNNGYTLINNGAKGADLGVAEGALMACLLNNDIDPYKRIKVFRPLSNPLPEFDFGHLRIVGSDLAERRDFAIKQSDIVVVMGGGSGTQIVATKAKEFGIPLLAIGIGSSNEASVTLWHDLWKQVETGNHQRFSQEDLAMIGPNQYDLRAAAQGVVAICNKLTQSM